MKPVEILKLFLILVLGAGCPKKPVEKSKPSTPQEALDQALNHKKARRFQNAEDGFTYLIFNFPGSAQAADAQFHLADCYFQAKNYEQAQNEFDFYLKNFPNGRYREEASFKRALSVLRSAPPPDKDQSNALKAKELLEEFLEEYPDSPYKGAAEQALAEIQSRIAHREFEAARLYFKAGEYKSALIYYRFIRDNYSGIFWPEGDRYQLAVCYLQTGNVEDARALLQELANGATSPRIKKMAQRQLNRLR